MHDGIFEKNKRCMEKSGSKIDCNLFIVEKIKMYVNEELKKSAKEHSNNLARLGKEIGEIQFNYKVLENTDKKYWENRIKEFKKYNEKGTEYYMQAHALMNLIDNEQAGLFLLGISKLRQIGLKLISNMEEVMQTPSIIKSKDKQQSKWSKEIREKLIETSNACLHHEMDMNKTFREFYEKHLKNILE